jgi:copper transport protein
MGISGAGIAGPGPDRDLAGLRRSVLAEVAIAIAVLAVTAVLVATQPAKTAYGPLNPTDTDTTGASVTSTRLAAGPLAVQVIAVPTAPRQLKISVAALGITSGVAQDVPEVDAELGLPAQGLGPLPVALRRTGVGQYSANDVDVPIAGKWQLTLDVRVDDFNAYSAQTTLTVD